MKKYIIRVIGALCVLASLVLTFLPAWVQIEGVKGKEIRTFRNELTTDLDFLHTWLVNSLDNEIFKEDLKDNNLPYTRSSIKNRIKETEELLRELINDKVTLKEALWLSCEAPLYIVDTENFLDTSIIAETSTSGFKTVRYEAIEETIDAAKEYVFVFYAVVALFSAIVILGIVAAVTHVLNKGRFMKYIFMSVVLLVVVGICVGVPILSEFIQTEFDLREEVEDISLRTTFCPYFVVFLTIVPVVLDCIFEHKKTKKLEA